MRRRSGLLFIGSLALTVSGCLDAAGPSRALSKHLSLYSVVQVGSALVQVLVEETLVSGSTRALEGATAFVQGAHGTSTLLEGAAGPGACFTGAGPGPVLSEPGCYSGLLPQPASGGDSLTLEVTLPDGAVVRGALRTPELPVASIPPDSQRVAVPFLEDFFPIAMVPVQLESAAGGLRVDVVAVVDTAYLSTPGDAIHPSACGVGASTNPFRTQPLRGQDDLLVYGVRCVRQDAPVPWDSVDLVVQVISMDENYADYTSHMLCSGVVAKLWSEMGIDGAVGVFGAVAVTELRVRLIYAPQSDLEGTPLPGGVLPQRYPC